MLFLWQTFMLPDFLEKRKWFKKLHECGLCGGVWIYSILAYFMSMDLLQVLGFTHVFFISELMTGGAISFVIHIFSIGWHDYFAPEIVL